MFTSLVFAATLAQAGAQVADVSELVDLDRLTRPADYVAVQDSSWDRASARGAGTEEWWANNDRGQYLRVEDGRHVLVDAKGPGAIVRFWSANPSGDVRIELDGEVVLDEDLTKLLTGEAAGFPKPYAEMTARGCSLYVPMPFTKSAKITCSAGDLYYQVHVRRYPEGTQLARWSRADLAKLPPYAPPSASGRTTTDRELRGPGVLRRLEIDLPEDQDELRSTLLTIRADDELCVQCPLGDFFGTGPGRNVYASAPMQITKDGVGICLFPMPFAKSLKIAVDADVRCTIEDGATRPFRFFAFYRGENQLKSHPRTDWPVAHLSGKAGRFVGCSLSVRNPVKAWWGEGDEKVYVDGETFPSFFGTGTEDYFGYAWCDPTLFQHPFHAQTRCDGPGNKGYTSVVRWHLVDDIPFKKSLRFDLEVWHWVESVMGFATVAYFYAEPGIRHDFARPTPEQLEILPLPKPWAMKNAIEGETFRDIVCSAGHAARQDLDFAEGFSNESHLWWQGAGPGATMRLKFEMPQAARGKLQLGLTKAPDYGIVSIALNGKVIVPEFDGFAERVEPAAPIEVDAALVAGANELLVTITGTNDRARPKNYMFGFDWLTLRR